MKTLRECIASAEQEKVAIGHFNISTLEMFWGVVRAARRVNVPVIVGVSEGERAFMGLPQVIALVRSFNDTDPSVFVNADHTYSLEKIREAVDAGCDSVIADGAKLSFDKNVALTREAVAYGRTHNVVVEGELGYIGEGSQIHEILPEGTVITSEQMTRPDEAVRFVAETGVDLLAPAVGTIHGIASAGNPHVDVARIREIKAAARVPLVLHGGSGVPDDELRAAIAAGISVIHISTDLRIAYKKSLARALAADDAELAPYKYLDGVVAAVENVTARFLRLFSGA